jgi:hypothetical protein
MKPQIYHIVTITNNLKKYPQFKKDTEQYPDLIKNLKQEYEIFIISPDGDAYHPNELFESVKFKAFMPSQWIPYNRSIETETKEKECVLQLEPNIAEKLTNRTHKVLCYAKNEAKRLNNEFVGSGHILLGLIKEHSGVAGTTLEDFGISLYTIREVMRTIKINSCCLKELMFQAETEANSLGDKHIGTEHMLLAICSIKDCEAYKILSKLSHIDEIKQQVLFYLGKY